jgi:hypothetical protein
MKQTGTVCIFLGLIVVFGLVFLYLRGAFHSEPEARKEPFITYSPIVQNSPQNYYHNELNGAGLPVCEAGNLGCYRTMNMNTIDPMLAQLYTIIMKIVPAGSNWVMVGNEPVLTSTQLLINSRELTIDEFVKLSKPKIRMMLAKCMCATYGICVSPDTVPDEKCDKRNMTLECMQSMFVESGCNSSGIAYPTKEIVSRMGELPPYIIYRFALDVLRKATTMPEDFRINGLQIKPAASILCGLPVNNDLVDKTKLDMVTAANEAVGNEPVGSLPINTNLPNISGAGAGANGSGSGSASGSNKLSRDPCDETDFQISYMCLKNKLYDIYTAQAK